MPKRVTRNWLGRLAWGLMSGALALSVLSTGSGSAPMTGARAALAEDIDCYNDKDLYNLPECVERRELDRKSGNQQTESQGAPIFSPGPTEGTPQNSGTGEQPSGGQQPPASSQPASTPQQPAAQSSGDDEEDDEEKPAPRPPVTDPRTVVLTIADAGKEATQYINDEGTDKYGKWVRTRFERDRSNGASALGPNVMDSKVWVAKDVEAAKALFKEQAAIKNFPERKEGVDGPVEKIKPAQYGEEFSHIGGYFQDDKIWQHHRSAMRVGNIVAVVYLFGREAFFQDPEDGGWTGQGDWFTSAVFHRM
jgi:hypothetical protein